MYKIFGVNMTTLQLATCVFLMSVIPNILCAQSNDPFVRTGHSNGPPWFLTASELQDAMKHSTEVNLYWCAILDEVYLEDCTIPGKITFTNCVFYKPFKCHNVRFRDTILFRECHFGEGDFALTECLFEKQVGMINDTSESGKLIFDGSDFLGNFFFLDSEIPSVSFDNVRFFEELRFLGSTISNTIDFSGCTFHGEANIMKIKSDVANFSASRFADKATFYFLTISEATNFRGAVFGHDTELGTVNFTGEVDFSYATFCKKFGFSGCRSEESLKFYGCLYQDTTVESVYFDNLQGNCTVLVEWEYSNRFNTGNDTTKNWELTAIKEKDEATIIENGKDSSAIIDVFRRYGIDISPQELWINDGKAGNTQFVAQSESDTSGKMTYKIYGNNHIPNQRGIKSHIEFDPTFFQARQKNHESISDYSTADRIYFTYRQEVRKRRNNWWHEKAELIFLELPFGYGVRPWRWVATFGLFIVPFGFFYSFQLKDDRNYTPWKKFLPEFSFKWGFIPRTMYWPLLPGLMWAFLHSLNTLTPGIDLHTLDLPLVKSGHYKFQREKPVVIIAQYFQIAIGWYLLALFFIMFNRIWLR